MWNISNSFQKLHHIFCLKFSFFIKKHTRTFFTCTFLFLNTERSILAKSFEHNLFSFVFNFPFVRGNSLELLLSVIGTEGFFKVDSEWR